MRKFTESDIFILMNSGNAIYNQIGVTLKSISGNNVINSKVSESLDTVYKSYKDALTLKAVEAVKKGEIILVHMPIDKRLPANIPYLLSKRQGKDVVIVDMSKYCTVEKAPDGSILSISVQIPKLYNMLIPAYMALKVLNSETVVSSETTKWMSYLWAKMFNKILMSQKIFVGSKERYEAFMYFAMRFFMIYYMKTNMAIVDNVSMEAIKGVKSSYIITIENILKQKNIDLYKNWETFARTMFSNDVTQLRVLSSVDMNIEQYLRLFSTYMGRDGAYLSLWSADYFFFCVFNAFNHSWILNDRAWSSIVEENLKIMPRIISGLTKEIL